MITACSNPDCHRELHYLRGGRVVRVIRLAGGVPGLSISGFVKHVAGHTISAIFPTGASFAEVSRNVRSTTQKCIMPMLPRQTFGNIRALMESKSRAEPWSLEL